MSTETALHNYPEWELKLDPGYLLVQSELHPAKHLVKTQLGTASLKEAVELARAMGQRRICVPVVYVEDEAGTLARSMLVEPRIVIKGDAYDAMPTSVVCTDFVLLCWPACARRFEQDVKSGIPIDIEAYHKLCFNPPNNEPVTPLHQRIETLAWNKMQADEAFAAFAKLFVVYSLSEELWRLHEWMDKFLPFHLENDPRMVPYRELLKKQVGHLFGDTPATTEHDWYASGSPIAGVPDNYPQAARFSIPERLKWLINQCRIRGLKKVAELGSIEGVSLFHLIAHAPDIEWHGYEVSKRAVARGHQLAKLNGLEDFLHLHDWDAPGVAQYDATVLFEILEHNSPEEGMRLLDRAAGRTRAGGFIFICTPCGNWSAFDSRTRKLDLRKDHCNAYTVERMTKFLSGWCDARLGPKLKGVIPSPRVVSVEYRDNPHIEEANGWVFALVELPQ